MFCTNYQEPTKYFLGHFIFIFIQYILSYYLFRWMQFSRIMLQPIFSVFWVDKSIGSAQKWTNNTCLISHVSTWSINIDTITRTVRRIVKAFQQNFKTIIPTVLSQPFLDSNHFIFLYNNAIPWWSNGEDWFKPKLPKLGQEEVLFYRRK